jgi:hypothetical protein
MERAIARDSSRLEESELRLSIGNLRSQAIFIGRIVESRILNASVDLMDRQMPNPASLAYRKAFR